MKKQLEESDVFSTLERITLDNGDERVGKFIYFNPLAATKIAGGDVSLPGLKDEYPKLSSTQGAQKEVSNGAIHAPSTSVWNNKDGVEKLKSVPSKCEDLPKREKASTFLPSGLLWTDGQVRFN